MSAAILQGCPATTLDTDLWIDLPPREYMRVLRLCLKPGLYHVAYSFLPNSIPIMIPKIAMATYQRKRGYFASSRFSSRSA